MTSPDHRAPSAEVHPQNVLFLCVANSARSQMAEGIARRMAPDGVGVFSAGSAPGRLNPLAVAALAELGIDISSHHSKGLHEVPLEDVDLVVTLCQDEVCPSLPTSVTHRHWPLPDPAAAEGTDEERLEAFRTVRDAIRAELPSLLGQAR